ncbi:MAG TPA: hypothetical protein VJ398_00545 [Acidimicrobiia bacterium]|nr:hypothetical protein [Acidimicrobiia bacterium]
MSRLEQWDAALLESLQASPGETMSLEEMASTTGISRPLLEALAREGLLVPRTPGRFDPTDVAAVKAGLALVEGGLPLGELLELARRVSEAMRPVAAEAVDLFARFVRDAVEAKASSPEETADGLVRAFRAMLPAAGQLVSSHFATLLLAEARRRLVAADPSR